MKVELTASVFADAIEGLGIQATPQWVLSEGKLALGPYYSYAEWQSRRINSIGSVDPTELTQTDELLFEPSDRMLWGVYLNDSNRRIPSKMLPVAWDEERPTYGTLRLSSATYFLLDHKSAYWIAPDGKMFVVLYDAALSVRSTQILRLRLSDDFDLLFAEGRLCGWMLSHPARYLSAPWHRPDMSASDADGEIAALLYDCIEIVNDPHVRRMNERDPHVLQELRHLLTRLDPSGDAIGPRRIMGRYLDQIIDKYYF